MPVESDRSDEVRLFLSADLIGSTSFKNKSEMEPAAYQGGNPPWAETFTSFYLSFTTKLLDKCQKKSAGNVKLEFFKAIGDEVVFTVALRTAKEAFDTITVFRECLHSYNMELSNEGSSLAVKGTAWLAGFPINNHCVNLPNGQVDYIGPSIDAGFRLSRFATQFKLVISVDLALLLLANTEEINFYFEGSESLKGVLGGKPYPILWVEAGAPDPETDLVGRSSLKKKDLKPFVSNYIKSCGPCSWLIVPYLPDDPQFRDPPPFHQQIREQWAKETDKQSEGLDQIAVSGDTAADSALAKRRVTKGIIGQQKQKKGKKG